MADSSEEGAAVASSVVSAASRACAPIASAAGAGAGGGATMRVRSNSMLRVRAGSQAIALASAIVQEGVRGASSSSPC